MKRLISVTSLLLVSVLAAGFTVEGESRRGQRYPAVIWGNPGKISSRNLYYGPGSRRLAPVPPFTFLKEDKDGESPKFNVRDARRTEWKVKLGPESQAETVATRLIWAVGYFAEETYYFERVKIKGLPHLSRGRQYADSNGNVYGARFEPRRRNVERGDTWEWDKNPFAGTRELNGLKVLMMMLNNYDARKENNRVLLVRGPGRNRVEARYVVTDLGATLGRDDGLGGKRSKNDLDDFVSTRFVRGVKKGEVEFDYDTRPRRWGHVTVLYPPYYAGEAKKERDMRGIPVEHARWIGGLLSQLTSKQLHDAFRAAGYDRQTAEGFVQELRRRITQLTRLR
jgi:hypothetical protein